MGNLETNIRQICVAVLRSLVHARRVALRERLEKLVFSLVEEAAVSNFDAVLRITTKMRWLVGFGSLIYEIEPMNGKSILEKLDAFYSEAMKETRFKTAVDDERTQELFSHLSGSNEAIKQGETEKNQSKGEMGKVSREAKKHDAVSTEDRLEAISIEKSGNGNGHKNEEIRQDSENAAIRQSEILEKIRQSGNDSMLSKDIVAAFPNVSQRTLRYDLQNLCREGFLIRIGQGGPRTAYQMRKL